MHWLQVVAPVLAVVVVIGVALLGMAFVSAVEAFQRIFGRDADADQSADSTEGVGPGEAHDRDGVHKTGQA